MDQFPHIIPTERSPRRELQLQGPRPTPLRINKDSHKIKKPPLPPQASHPQPPPRQPIIIYTVSPKVIHTTPGDFMNLVQRLTGSSSSSSSSSSNLEANNNDPFNAGGVVSPAARYATIEKAMSPMGKKQLVNIPSGGANSNSNIISDEIMGHAVVERSQNMFQGILSPGPASLSPIPSNFFSPPSSDPSMVSFLHDLSPVLHSGRNLTEGAFVLPSPSSNFSFVSPHTPSIDLFNYFLD
uniref:Protein MKS1 n=2 Tax=Cajanus cajan TaxID=3821 RepID=A0A151TGT1_CAJCA|nr:Protein MKS1 [Cajanus cajan]